MAEYPQNVTSRQVSTSSKTQRRRHRSIKQDHAGGPAPSAISAENRRLLLGASLRLLLRRLSGGQQILHTDVIRLATLADDAEARP